MPYDAHKKATNSGSVRMVLTGTILLYMRRFFPPARGWWCSRAVYINGTKMIDHGKKNLLGVQIDAIDYEAAVEKLITAAHARKRMAVSALAVHGVMTGVLDKTHRYRLNHLDLVTPDGQPVRWALNLLYGTGLTDRVYGPTLMLELCGRAVQENLPIYLYGSRPATVDKLSEVLRSRFPGLAIAGKQPSLFRKTSAEEKEQIAEAIRRSGATITFVGLGCPRQEVWLYEYRDSLSMPLIAVGGAFDIHAGNIPQAPPYMQRVGMEWLYRFIQEPRRLWRRYLLLNPLYVALVILQASRLVPFDPSLATPPTQEVRYG
jgi:N-acetylglucosaminyldiphosphoundecaprenol N-acetyl-beta-D-mannosaminyltransferase